MPDRPHVLFLVAWYPDEEHSSNGVFIREHALATALYSKVSVVHIEVEKSAIGRKNDVAVSEVSDALTEYRILVNTPVRRFGFHNMLACKAATKAIKEIQSTRGEIDLYHVHVRNHITKLFVELPVLKSIPFLLTEHWSFYHTLINNLPENEQTEHELQIKKWFNLKELKYICPVSHDLGGILTSRFGAAESKIRIIPNVANEVFVPALKRAKSNGKTRLVLVAIWNYPKNPMLFIEALLRLSPAELDQFTITWIGDGSQMEEVRAAAESNNLDLIDFLGMQPKTIVAKNLQEADYLIHPTDAENLPCIIIESLSCGTPVISMDVNGIPELIDEHNGILVPVKDLDALTAALRSTLEQSKFDRAQIAAAGADQYSAEAIGTRYFELYTEVLKTN
jgi:glycosyltransferase involved in cell wall biosynthesis